MPETTPHEINAESPRARRNLLGLLGWIVVAGAAGAVGAVASRNATDFYSSLVRPAWAPPGWLFGPVWTTLYLLMGIAAWLVWRTHPTAESSRAARRHGLVLFVIQLVLNALWSWLFFAWRQGSWAFAEVVLLWLAIAATMWQFHRVRSLAAWLLAPYIGWVTFATALTWAIWQRNPDQL